MRTSSMKKLRTAISCTANFMDKEFTFTQIERALKLEKVSTFEFYRLYYAGAVDKVRLGTYKINPLFYKISVAEIYSKSTQKIKEMREQFNRKKAHEAQANKANNLQPNIFATNDKVSEAISLLKSLGYKIMKPIQQFEEI